MPLFRLFLVLITGMGFAGCQTGPKNHAMAVTPRPHLDEQTPQYRGQNFFDSGYTALDEFSSPDAVPFSPNPVTPNPISATPIAATPIAATPIAVNPIAANSIPPVSASSNPVADPFAHVAGMSQNSDVFSHESMPNQSQKTQETMASGAHQLIQNNIVPSDSMLAEDVSARKISTGNPPPPAPAMSVFDNPANQSSLEPFSPHHVFPAVPAGAGSSPWDSFDTETSRAISIDEAAKREEDAKERARLTELAMSTRSESGAEYLKSLSKWNGPFETRTQKNALEQDIIRQVGYTHRETPYYDNSPIYDWEKEQEKGFDWSVLDPANFFTKVRDWVGLGPDERKANEAMKAGREILLANPDLKSNPKILEAAKHFKDAAKRWPSSVLEEDALHLAGECFYFGGDYNGAMTAYHQLVIQYQHSKYTDNAVRRLFLIGRYWEAEDRRGASFVNATDKSRPTFDTFGFSKKAYEAIFINDPNGPISDDAVMALASAYLAKGRYQGDPHFEQAAYYFNYLREHYPLSKHITKAHELELFAKTNAYMGAEHSDKVLSEAEKLADVTLRQLGSELDPTEKQEVLALKEEVIMRQAEREWTLGQYYDKKKYYGAARIYYEKLLDRYPQTEFATKARIRLEEVKDKPAKPDQLGFLKQWVTPKKVASGE
ncbi:MAG: tetratricopeptide repeat protein [Thermoguttaceae bacterium]